MLCEVLARAWWSGSVAVLAMIGCGPAEGSADVYPRNCGVEGPVDLFEASEGDYLDVHRAGDHYLLVHAAPDGAAETWAIDRCGESRTLLQAATLDPSPSLGVAADWILSCDEDTGAVAVLDPTGREGPRVLFPSIEKSCRVVPFAGGLAAQARGSGLVWFNPDPADPNAESLPLTEAAEIFDPDWTSCSIDFACESGLPSGRDLRTAGDELLVVTRDGELIGFDPTSLEPHVIDAGPVEGVDVLQDGRRIVVDRHLGPTLVIDRETGSSFEFCCQTDIEPIVQLGDWLVHGSWGPPRIPAPAEWQNFSSRHLQTGESTEVSGRDDWGPFARLTAETILADIRPEGGEYQRHVVWPATGDRRPVDIPGEIVWTLPDRDGVWIWDGLQGHVLRVLDGPDTAPRELLVETDILFPTRAGRIVVQPWRDDGVGGPVQVMMPDETIIDLDEDSVGGFRVFDWGSTWPVDRDEVVYVARRAGRSIVRRTVLP